MIFRQRHANHRQSFNCLLLQGTKQFELNKHINLKHSADDNKVETIKCYHCDMQFSSRWSLMNHRKSNHPNNIASCKNFQDGKCSFAENMCWWSHEKNESDSKVFKCFNCS